MKWYRKPLAALLCLLAVLTSACALVRPSAVALGRFVETEVTAAGGLELWAHGMLVHADGSSHFISSEDGYVDGEFRRQMTIQHSVDGFVWQNQDGWQADLDDEPQAVSVAEDGTVFAAVVQTGASAALGQSAKIYRITPAGQASVLYSTDLEPRSGLQLLALPQQRLLCTVVDRRGGHTLLLDAATGSQVADLGWGTGILAANQDVVVSIGADGDVAAFKLEDGQPTAGYATGMGAEGLLLGLTLDAAGNLYSLTVRGVNKLAPEGQVVETIMEGSMFSFGSPAYSPVGFCACPDGGFLIAYNVSGCGSKLLRYDYDPTMPAFPDQDLVIYSLRECDTVRAAAMVLQKSNPSVRVNYQVGLQSGADQRAVEDALRVLNTDLLAGNGPDLLILDGMPLQSYVEKGMLLDLQDLVSTDQLLRVATALATEDGLYAISTRVKMPMLYGPKALLDRIDSLDSLVQLVQQNPGRGQAGLPLLRFKELRSLFDLLYQTSAPALLADGTIDREHLAAFLQTSKTIADKYRLLASADQDPDAYPKEALLSTGLMTYTGHFTFPLARKPEDTAVVCPGLVQQPFIPSLMVGINARSQQRGLAADLINVLLGQEVQQLEFTADGVPVRADVINPQLQGMADMYAEWGIAMPRLDVVAIVSWLTTPVLVDDNLVDQFYQGMAAYCQGEQSLQEAISGIEQATELYLAERR